MNKFADLHIHSTLKPFIRYRNKDKKTGNIWYQDKPRPRERDNSLVRYSEADFTTLVQSGVKIAFVALYSFEQGWVNSWKTGPIADFLIHAYTHFPIKQINYIQNKDLDYFKALSDEINFLSRQIKGSHKIEINGKKEKFHAKIPKNDQELNKFLQEKNTLIIIPTIEGANALYNGNAESVDYIKFDQLERNIDILKNKMCPFFITLAHHFDNGLCGHAKSIYGTSTLEELIIPVLLNQKKGLKNDLNRKGLKIISKLLAINEFKNEKRILIDVKHMNSISRQSFYNFLNKYKSKNPDDKIPIIASHVGYNGHTNYQSLEKLCSPNSEIPYTETQRDFNEAIINLCDKDVLEIFKSEGLIGINLDQRIISNKKIVDEAERKFNYKDTPELKLFWAKQITKNIVGMAKAVINEKLDSFEKIWDLFSIGSDFDGFINPVDAYITTNDYAELKKYLLIAFEEDSFVQNNTFGLSFEKIIDKIMFKNANDFLLKHFYKKSGLNV